MRSSPTFSVSTLVLALTLAGCATPPAATPSSGASAGASGAAPKPGVSGMPTTPTPPAAGTSAPGVAALGVAPPAAAASGAAPGARPAPPVPGALPPFDVVAKDFKKTDGLFGVWRKDDKVWLELKPEDFNKPFYLSPKLSRGMGEPGFFGGSMYGRWGNFGRPQIVEFQRVVNQVRLVALNSEFRATTGTPEARAVAAGFSRSLLASSMVASAPHAERKTVLVDANALFAGDIQGLGMQLQRAYRQGYSLDPRHSGIDNVRGKPDALVFELTQHYYAPSIAVPQPMPPGTPPGMPVPTTPQSLPDVRSLFLGLNISISKLPDVPMAPRKADARVGYFYSAVQDYSSDLARTPRVRYVNRWRLEKKDPAAELSEPIKPITYWLDKTIPLAYRAPITEGVLEWNKAFERIGFKNAIVVKMQPDDADFDTLDVNVASLRWMTNAAAQFGAIGPSQLDPRTGEILDADISFESLSSRSLRTLRAQILGGNAAAQWSKLLQSPEALPWTEGRGPSDTSAKLPISAAALGAPSEHAHGAHCDHADAAAEQMSYAMDVLEANGNLDPDSPQAQQFVLDYLKDVTMHEVGHTLGLRHNFRSSRVYTDKQLSDEAFTRKTGLAGSVMEYAPINLPRPGEKPALAWQLTLGPYDYWAIEYAYKPIDPKLETAELQRIASRSAEPELAYGTDEDNYLGIDPESLHFDLGDDPVAFGKKRFEIGRDLLARQESRALKPEEDYGVLRRAVTYAVRDMGRATGVLARQIGGLRTLRDHPGSGRDPMQPVPAAVQRAALDLLAKEVFAVDSLRVSPALLRKMAPDFDERGDASFSGGMAVTDFSFDTFVGGLRKALLGQLMSDSLAARILESAEKVGPGEAFKLSELYGRLSTEIWGDLGGKGDISGPRRELQREHVNRLASAVVRPASSRADTRSLLRAEAQGLLKRLEAASRRGGLSAESRAHLQDSTETLQLALGAKMQRMGL